MLRKLRDDFSPEYLAAVFDVAGPTFRDEQADGGDQHPQVRHQDADVSPRSSTKATRLTARRCRRTWCSRCPYIRRALEAYRIPILELRGFEADDVIGTLARKAAEASHLVYVVSSDKDMMQLVNDKVQF